MARRQIGLKLVMDQLGLEVRVEAFEDRLILQKPVRTLRQDSGGQTYHQRTPAVAAGLADHVWALREWLTFPAKL